jgi:hypothetical protein
MGWEWRSRRIYRGEEKGVDGAPARLFIVRNWIEKWRERKKVAAKHAAWRAELDRFGVWEVRLKLSQAGAGSFVYFASGGIEREFVEQRLSKKVEAAERQQAAILAWARIAAWASLMAVFFTLLTVLLIPEAQNALRAFAASVRAWLGK